MATDPLVHIHKTVVMQRPLDGVLHGHHFRTCGRMLLDTAEHFSAKPLTSYRVYATEAQ
ncbi:hypothetical protein [Sediminicurvatus halobius]|uniref:hypothetical protein n=1 Tax=Sediminicurvatus halobius TaxID=2182432 RepID=UPI0013049489|nr:hypothetical protein [Spiribacter halobius]UEX76754.1 hypothetical protein LMH63_12395 [Spiribacter halobius]